jgi:fructose-1,6-bisphosphatase II
MENAGAVNPALVFSLRRVTERAACAAFNWIGRGDGGDGGRAALDAMRSALAEIDIDAVVVIGEATKGEAPQPQRGAMMNPGPAFYMEKFVASAPARGKIDPRWPPEKKLATLAEALGKDISELTVFVLEKPRHRELVNAISADRSCRAPAPVSRSIRRAMWPAR